MIQGRRGASLDNFYVLIAFFGLAIFMAAVIVFWNIAYAIPNFWTLSSIGLSIRNSAQSAYNSSDSNMVMMYIGLHIGILLVAFLLRSHPVVYVASIFLLVILIVVAAPISNAYDNLKSDATLSTAIATFPMTNYFMSNLPAFEAVWGFVTCVFLYGLSRYEGLL